jgi:hypothetical protein
LGSCFTAAVAICNVGRVIFISQRDISAPLRAMPDYQAQGSCAEIEAEFPFVRHLQNEADSFVPF